MVYLIEKALEQPISLLILVLPALIKQLRIWHLNYLNITKDN
ncbi:MULTISPECIES: hypothetical protein [Staphylococcus]|uniref:Uncharacterized protein n=1 Tax=uncultured Caudovirales phage TaxID=2100421 RepID=A0A2H4J650_9CAUD|nr:hypothetical protein [Staphylococcus capitis]ASN69503.1 hypothetical protein 10S13_39 [uncultured Caudovirales phage]MDH8713303.1 hypothetical protein [Staphylococcus epidermidis]RQM99946.1 hypothetical protein CPA43_03485 [Staphylococcus warneri]ATN02495.1 hypothetical protein CRN29_04645 [Staphylococcus capitis]RQN01239.1 hypothetical protein CPA44_00050 [Staphylococcus warneri]